LISAVPPHFSLETIREVMENMVEDEQQQLLEEVLEAPDRDEDKKV
jgi:hypothetical protein